MVKIFLVEDNRDLLTTFEVLLKLNGIENVEKALDGEEAMQKYNNFKEKPDIIILDHRLPKKNGLEIMSEILKRDINTKIIFISADYDLEKDVLNKGAKSFLKKPITGDKLMKEINLLLD